MSDEGQETKAETVVRYPYVVSVVVLTFRFESRPHRVRSDDARYVRGIPYMVVSLLFGWWGVPWGPIQTWRAVWDCLSGGVEVEG
jgi:hypothetical protein